MRFGFAAAALTATYAFSVPVIAAAPPEAPAAATPATNNDPTVPLELPLDVRKTLVEADDLSILAALSPLKLTATEIDKLTETMRVIAREGVALTKQDYETVRALSADVSRSRAGMLKGQPADADVAARIAKANTLMDARLRSAHTEAVRRVADALADVLTTEQSSLVESGFAADNKGQITVPANIRTSPAKTKTYLQDQARLWFADRYLLGERSLLLLTELRKGTASDPAAAAPVAAAPAVTAVPGGK